MNPHQNGNIPLANGLPSSGQQTDMTHLWNLVQQLSEALAENRAQTAGIINGVQQIQARAAADGAVPTATQVNGELNANLATQNAALETENMGLRNKNTRLEAEVESFSALLDDYENAMKLILDKLRPYAYNHQQTIIAIHKHYNNLLEQERQEKLEQSLEHTRWQAGLGKVAEYARQALAAQSEDSLPYVTKIAELKHENKILRRLVGWQEASDSSEDEDEAQQKLIR